MKDNNNQKEITVFDIANYIIVNSKNDPNLTHMKLHKVIYYSYVKYLLKYKKPLISEKPKAWLYGPVFGKLYFVLKEYYEKQIKKPLPNGKLKKIDIGRQKVIDEILNLCKKLNGYKLSYISHTQEPWIQIYNQRYENNNNIIPDNLLVEYFSKKDNVLK
ncbi:MAG: DUF4065 domain-containing protein [Phytoplasma sp.]|uniref:Panacea domain-containing protein n=1 Tax=Phytoplasma sp. TaxID=2155 RepID=UPI002B417AC8|nr:type II toxin-antitoxin system antitoxin SocA domain-containing protein [Phytoplasma sp.]WRH06746.1 MAG: DUF4065 domain-containing protein [Phytoplasma sp.]